MRARLRIGDGLVLVAATALVVALFAAAPGGQAEHAEVFVADQRVARFALDRDGDHTVEGPLGPARLVIADGAIRFMESPCRAQRCVHSGWQRYPGHMAACLPNRMVVRVVGRGAPFDSLAF